MGSEYSTIERSIAVFLSKIPRVKHIIKYIYHRLNFFIYKQSYSFKSNFDLISFSYKNQESFFGYYDKSPINSLGKYIVFHSTSRYTGDKPSANDKISIVLMSFKDFKIIKEFSTVSYNWQQGSKLQWIDGNRFIFNDFDEDTFDYCSYIVNADTSTVEKKLSFPIYDSKNDFAYTLNFDRLALLRPDYGYRNKIDNGFDINLTSLADDGIYYCDLIQNTKKLIISLDSLSKFGFKEPLDALHKVNHIMISPNGNFFIFLHRYFINGRKFDRLILSNRDGSHLKILSDQDMVSHCYWFDNNSIISFMRDFELGDKYYLIDIHTGEYKPIGKDVIDLYGDGHPSNFGDFMIFDTYPNRSRMKELFLYNFKTNQVSKMGEFLESFQFYGETRCDLHPKWSLDGNWIFIDSVHSGKRQLYGININKFFNNE